MIIKRKHPCVYKMIQNQYIILGKREKHVYFTPLKSMEATPGKLDLVPRLANQNWSAHAPEQGAWARSTACRRATRCPENIALPHAAPASALSQIVGNAPFCVYLTPTLDDTVFASAVIRRALCA
jgi:hypothetical protein